MNAMTEIFQPPERWYGGWYELAIQVGPHGNDAALRALLELIWNRPELTGPYASQKTEPDAQPIAAIAPDARHYYGCLQLAHKRLACGTYVVQEDCEPGGSDWVLLYVPVQEAEWKLGGNGIGDDFSRPALAPLADYYATVADMAYREYPFAMALAGWEVSGSTSAESIGADLIETRHMGIGLPPHHTLVQQNTIGEHLPSGLIWYKPNTNYSA
jgi:hypothetical protein